MSPDNVIVMTGEQLDHLIRSTIEQTKETLQPYIEEALVHASYGKWVKTKEALEILGISAPTIPEWRDRPDTKIIYKAEGKFVRYQTASLYQELENLGSDAFKPSNRRKRL